jgi:hypothetical protein
LFRFWFHEYRIMILFDINSYWDRKKRKFAIRNTTVK